jgi:hypothetical protein
VREKVWYPPEAGPVIFVYFDERPNHTSAGQSFSASYPVVPQRNYFEVVSADAPGSKKEWKPFQHYKSAWNSSPSPSTWAQFSDTGTPDPTDHRVGYVGPNRDPMCGFYLGSGTVGEYAVNHGLPSWYVPDSPDGFVPYPENLELLTASAMNSMMPLVKSELSSLNSLYELKDVVSLKHTLAHLDKSFVNLANLTKLGNLARATQRGLSGFLSSGFGSTSKATLKQLVHTSADAFLQWKFNIRPMLSDIAAVRRAMSEIKKRINRLLDNAEKVRHAHFTRVFTEYNDTNLTHGPYDVGPTSSWYPPLISTVVRRDVVYEPSKFHAEVEYSYYYTDFQTEYAQLLGFLDAFGVNLNPAIIWNAYPWTFVVDWVVGVSRWLDTLKFRNMTPVIVIHRYLWSIRRQRHISTLIQRNCGWYANGADLRPTVTTAGPHVVETCYGRYTKMPPRSSFLTSGISSDELLLGTALVITRRSGRKHRPHSRT